MSVAGLAGIAGVAAIDRSGAAIMRWAATMGRCGAAAGRRAAVVLCAFAPVLASCGPDEQVRATLSSSGTLSVSQTLAAADTTGFARAMEPREFRFPEDHGPHREFLHEWWYFTGNLRADDGREFGFQVTFFRSALGPGDPEVDSPWATRQAYMGHFALTDIAGERFHAFERFERGALDLAGAGHDPVRVWIGDWDATLDPEASFPELPVFRVRAAEGDVAIDLELRARRPRVLQGDDGLSRKGPEPGNASYYYSFTRMDAEGEVRLGAAPGGGGAEQVPGSANQGGGEAVPVAGSAWLDREWGTSALGPGLAGWDWFAIQLDSGADLMVYRLRRDDGATDPFSAGTFVAADGRVARLGAEDFGLDVTGEWTAPSGVRYPSGWRVQVPSEGLDLRVMPRLRDQELDLTFRYWEGAVSVQGEVSGRTARGVGYVELTGYEGSAGPPR